MRRRRVEVGAFPVWRQRAPLADFLRYQGKGLSARATRGFLLRTERSSLRFPPGFLDALRRHVVCIEAAPPARAIRAFAAE
jgi:DNA (cytosine-5)-methyltransferase 1